MYGDMGTMMISVDDGTAPWELTGRCYHDADPETGADCIYQIMEYMTGPPHGCMFRVRKIEGPRSEIQNDAMQQIRKTENVSLVHPSDEYCPQICKLC
jgi:hypothetical protein